MKSILLATGFVSRLQPFTDGYPVSLLEIDGKSIIDRLLSDVDAMEEVDGHLIVTNDVCFPYLKAWLIRSHYKKPLTLINEGLVCTQEGLNHPMCDILYVIEKQSISEDVLVLLAGSVVDGSLMAFVRQARLRDCSSIACYRENSLTVLKNRGAVVFDQDLKVVAVHDRPQVPSSRWGVAPFAYLTGGDVVNLYKAVAGGAAFDSPNSLLAWLCITSILYAWVLPNKWFYIDDASTYEAADNLFKNKRIKVQT